MGLHETLAQQEYVARQNRRRRLVAVCRILLLVLLLALWELGARLGLINDFIFSSPSRTALCFISMARDGSIFLHTGVTLLETLGPCRRPPSLVQPHAFRHPGAISGHAQQPAQIGPGPHPHRLAGQ